METGTPAPRRRMRADARRNYERLLTEAASAFAEHGADFSLEEIARRAGVANGTLYGHFPTRRALLEALLGDRMRALAATGEELLADPSPFDGLAAWARTAMAHTTVYRGLGAALMEAVEDETSELHTACKAVLAAGEELVARARAAGEVRTDVTAPDLYALVNAAAWAGEQSSAAQGERLLTFGLDGLRSSATTRPVAPRPAGGAGLA
ncbi:TetR/AcrR family transcriptional regulator [Nonomuraea sp. K274]|uniref:TetR/AcrR family transcriptional regulator n=1 Tax=Nonomuraea cypriaca TaxID=1187855 RepID=A0A931AGZ8_9ACTN|nr:TetR/AcrR family transcriptional regulator [Nonomuraea cypriaca]MBF8189970.1 TetR/AcrR family transcriptional regulator [Nonomuraea cypriaca]